MAKDCFEHRLLLRQRKERLEGALMESEHLFVHVLAPHPELRLPSSLQEQNLVTLKLSKHFQGEMRLLSDRVIAGLLFPEGRFSCEVPYECIAGITDPKGNVDMWMRGSEMSNQEDPDAASLHDEPNQTTAHPTLAVQRKGDEVPGDNDGDPPAPSKQSKKTPQASSPGAPKLKRIK